MTYKFWRKYVIGKGLDTGQTKFNSLMYFTEKNARHTALSDFFGRAYPPYTFQNVVSLVDDYLGATYQAGETCQHCFDEVFCCPTYPFVVALPASKGVSRTFYE